MDAGELRNLFRAEVRDDVEPYLWSDTEVYAYLTQAQLMFCQLTGGIPTVNPTFTVTAGTTYFELPASLLRITSARASPGMRDLLLLNQEDLQTRSELNRLATSGPAQPTAMVIGELDGHARLLPIPATDVDLTLIGHRLPNEPLAAADDIPEIRQEHHYHLLLWVKHLAHLKADAETFDKGRSADFATAFRVYCEQARQEQERRAHKPRTVMYGGY